MYRENVTPVNYVNSRAFPLERHSATKELILPECNNGVINHNQLPTVLVTLAAMLYRNVRGTLHSLLPPPFMHDAVPLLSY